jgi:tRNA G18 (ribose-2'-O)-methylase SpoU
VQIISITSLDDPRVAVYRNLKDRELIARHGRFIAEGDHVVRRLFASRFRAESVLVSENRAAGITAAAPAGTTVYVAPQAVLNQIVGFRFHTGVLAAGVREPSPKLDDVIPPSGDVFVVVCPDLNNAENLGSMIRLSAGFGAAALVVGETCHDPWVRQTIRVSMGTIFSLPIVRSDNIASDLKRLGEMNVQRVATVLGSEAEVLSKSRRSPRMAILFGSEAHGLPREHVALCERRVTIPMKLGTDSLNVAVAAGIVLHHFTTCRGRSA